MIASQLRSFIAVECYVRTTLVVMTSLEHSSLEDEDIPQGLLSIKTRLSPETTRVGFILIKNQAYKNPQAYRTFLEVGELPLDMQKRPDTTYVKNQKDKKLQFIYTGEWIKKSKLFHGIGSVVYFDGQIFEGNFEKGDRKGYGRLIDLKGELIEGTWNGDVVSGVGRLIYEGKRYKGEILNRLPHGNGSIRLRNGAVYEGSFVNGLMHGKGQLSKPGAFTYTGDFNEGRIQGIGRLVWVDGRIYEGEVVDGEAHGKGVQTWLDGQRYQGWFVSGRRQGLGMMIYTDQAKYEGDWKEDRRHGQGTLTLASGEVKTGVWLDDNLPGETPEGNVSFSQSSIAREEDNEDDLPEVVAKLNQQKWSVQGPFDTSMGSLEYRPEKEFSPKPSAAVTPHSARIVELPATVQGKPVPVVTKPSTQPVLTGTNRTPVVENPVVVERYSVMNSRPGNSVTSAAVQADTSSPDRKTAPVVPPKSAKPALRVTLAEPTPSPNQSLSPVPNPLPALKSLVEVGASPKPVSTPQLIPLPVIKSRPKEVNSGDFGFRPIDLQSGLALSSPEPALPAQPILGTKKTETELDAEEIEAVSWKRPVLPANLFSEQQRKKSTGSESEDSFVSYALRGREKESSQPAEPNPPVADFIPQASSASSPLPPEFPHFLNNFSPISGFNPLHYLHPKLVEIWNVLPLFPFANLPLDPEPPTVVMKWIPREDAYYRGYIDSEQRFAGFGVLLTRDSVTEGQWTDGELNGMGRKVTINSILTGFWRDGSLYGFGTCLDLRMKTVYSGDWEQSEPEGIGCLSSATQLYMGGFRRGVKEGQGRMVTEEMEYEGEFQDGDISGFGKAMLRNGGQYVGTWIHGVPQGLGVHSTSDHRLFYGKHSGGKGVQGRYLIHGEAKSNV